MCGIVGIISPNSADHIASATAAMRHRGPDDTGVFQEKNLALGFQRLAIQDLSPAGHQPMHSTDGRYVLIFNGEIYNHLEVRAKLEEHYTFHSTGDAETLLYGFAHWGTEVLHRLNGIFAFAIFDRHTGILTLARDHFGVKPLYFYEKSDAFAFASEIKSLLTLPGFDRSLDSTAWVNYLTYLWSPGERTPFERVKKLEAGHFLQLDIAAPQHFRVTKYYEIPFTGTYSASSEAELVDELDRRLLRAVERQLLSDVPVGFFLSGGLDSSAVVAMARRLRPDDRLQCYTIDTGEAATTPDGFSSDLPHARQVAAHLRADLRVVSADVDILRDFDHMVWHLDEPQADPAPLNILNISRQARSDGYVVLLGGTGGDDLFSGYRRHQALRMERFFEKTPLWARRYARLASLALPTHWPMFRRLRKLLAHADREAEQRLAGYFSWMPLAEVRGLFSEKTRADVAGYDPAEVLLGALQNIPQEHDRLNQMLFWELKFFLADHNLNYTDKLSMAVGVEVRVPFLDRELVEFSTRIPPHLKMRGMTTKYLLRKTMERYLPHEVIYRPKAGFGAPVREWVAKDLQPMMERYLSEEAIAQRGIFDPKAVQKLIADNRAGRMDAAYTVWSLLAAESWLRQFMD